MQSSTKKLCRLYVFTMLLVTVIFIVLYFPFLSEQYLYAYPRPDIGSDTTTTYLPKIIFDIKSILQGEFNSYTLQRGLGEYYDSPLYKYLNVVNLPLLLLGEKHMHWALLISMYLKYAAICFFALLFFRRLLRDDRLASVCALLWTYSGYAVLWGQHYQNLTNVVFLTIALYGLQLFLEHDRKRFLLIPALASLAYSSYYCLYTSCYLFAAYSIGFLIFRRAGTKEILKKAGAFALSLILAVGIAGECIFPELARFFESTRVSDVSGENANGFFVYPVRYLLTFLARLLSNDTIGVGNNFSGTKNYYEAAILSVSIMFIFMLVLLLQSEYRKRVAACTLACVAALCLGPVSRILNFSDDNQRWTFVYCFLEVVLIGVGLKYLFSHSGQPGFSKKLFRTVLIADGIYLLFLVLLCLAQSKYRITLNVRTCILIVVFLALYRLFFLFVLPHGNRRWKFAALALLVAVELVAMNYRSVNTRTRVKFEEWYGGMYYDGTGEIVDWIQNQDDSLYRINKSYDSVRYNDSLVQGYRGMAVYSSTNARELVDLYTFLGYTLTDGYRSHWIRFSAEDDVVNALLGVKYLITRSEDEPDEAFYKEVYSSGEFRVYENQLDLGFGYLYQNQIPQWQFETLRPLEKHVALTEGYCFSDEEITNSEPLEIEGFAKQDIIPYFEYAVNCKAQVRSGVLYVYATGDESADMQLIFDCSNLPEEWYVSGMTVEMSMAEEAIAQVFVMTDETGYSEEKSVQRVAQAEEDKLYFSLSKFDRPLELRFDPSHISQDVEIKSITLHLSNDEAAFSSMAKLRENRITDFSQNGNTFTGSITNPWEENAMLCIPLIYSSHWYAEVDGEAAEVQNINGGLVGIGLDSGFHEISITYYDNTQQIGQIVGLTSCLIYMVGAVIWWRRKGKYEIPMDIYEG